MGAAEIMSHKKSVTKECHVQERKMDSSLLCPEKWIFAVQAGVGLQEYRECAGKCAGTFLWLQRDQMLITVNAGTGTF